MSASAWTKKLSDVTGWEVPSRAWAAVDYHLSWLHGALAWTAGTITSGQPGGFPPSVAGNVPLVSGNQEDVDLLLAWTHGDATRLLAVEAKGFTYFANKQMRSKLERLDAITCTATAAGVPLELRAVLTSRVPPTSSMRTAGRRSHSTQPPVVPTGYSFRPVDCGS